MESDVGHDRPCNHVEKVVVNHNRDRDEPIIPVPVFLVDQVVAAYLFLWRCLAAIREAISSIYSIVYLDPKLLVLVVTEATECAIDVALHPLLGWLIEVLPSLVRFSLVLILSV